MTSTTVPREHVPAWVGWLGVGVSTAFAVGGTLAVWSQRSQLPARVAKHWGADGQPDGYQSVSSFMVFQLVFVLGLALVLLAVGQGVRALRPMCALATGMAAFLSVVLATSVLTQRGVEDPSTVPLAQWAMFPGLGAGVVTALVVWLVVRRHGPAPLAAHRLPAAGAPTLPAGAGPVVAWSGHTRRGRLGSVLLVVAGIVPMVVIILIAAVHRQWGMMVFLLVPAAAVLLSAAFLGAQVTIGRGGVRARGLGLVPVVTIPLETIEQADVLTHVSCMGDYGGYGYRVGFSGTRGLVTADGPGLRIQRAGQLPFVITVDDAERAAATVNTLVARREAERHA